MRSKKSVLEIIEQVRDTVLKKQLIECSTTIIVSISGGQDSVFLLFCLSFLQFQLNFTFKMVWCNHFWQIDSFYTTLHLTMCAINFASPLITFLPLHIFDVDLMFLQAQKVVRPYTFTGSYLSCIFLSAPHTNLTAYFACPYLLLRSTARRASQIEDLCDQFVIAMSLLAPTEHDKKMHGTCRAPHKSNRVRGLIYEGQVVAVHLLAPTGHSKEGHARTASCRRCDQSALQADAVWAVFLLAPPCPFGTRHDKKMQLRDDPSVLWTTCHQKASFYTNKVGFFSLNFVKTRPKSFCLGLPKKLNFTLLKFQKPAVRGTYKSTHVLLFALSLRDKKMHGNRCDGTRRCMVQHSNHKPKVCVGAPSHQKYVRHGLHDIFRQIFQTKFVPVRRQLLIRQVKTFLSIYQITELNLFLTFAKTKVNFLDLCCPCIFLSLHTDCHPSSCPEGTEQEGACVWNTAITNRRFVWGRVHQRLILTAFFACLYKGNLIKIFCRCSPYPRIIGTSCRASSCPKFCCAKPRSRAPSCPKFCCAKPRSRASSCPFTPIAVHLLVPKGQSKKEHVCIAVRACPYLHRRCTATTCCAVHLRCKEGQVNPRQHTNLRFVRSKKGHAQQAGAPFTPIASQTKASKACLCTFGAKGLYKVYVCGTQQSQTGPHSIRYCAFRTKERLGLCGARAQSSFACIDKKNITMSSETKARHWRHITTQRSSTFYTSEKAIYGHTLSDRVETIIFNLIRGSGNTGVKSLSWKRKLSTFSYNKFYLSLQQVVKNTHLLLEL